MIIWPAGGAQELFRVDKAADGSVSARTLFGVRYVPLVAVIRMRFDIRNTTMGIHRHRTRMASSRAESLTVS